MSQPARSNLAVASALVLACSVALGGCAVASMENEQESREAIIQAPSGPPVVGPLTSETGPVDPNAPDSALACGAAVLPPRALDGQGCTSGVTLTSDLVYYSVFACPLGLVPPPPANGSSPAPNVGSAASPPGGVYVATGVDSHCVGNPNPGWELVFYLAIQRTIDPRPQPGCGGSVCDDPQLPVNLPGPISVQLLQ